MLFVAFAILSPLHAYSRIGLGASWSGIDMQGDLDGDNGIMKEKTMGPFILIEGEYMPVNGLSIFMRGQVNPFKPAISIGGEDAIRDGMNDAYTLAGSFNLGLGWQLPFQNWSTVDVPIDLTLGLGATLNLLHLQYETPFTSVNNTELALGMGAFLSFSWYFSSYFGISLSTMPSVTVADWSMANVGATGAGVSSNTLGTGTALQFSWDAALLMTVRFGY